MDNTKPFSQFESRARTLQRMINFNSATPAITNLQLAKWITLGLPDNLWDPFQFPRYAKQVRIYYKARPRRAISARTRTSATPAANNTGVSSDTRESQMSEEL
ncbi:hypothetical protein PTTG_10237 [Puccinia triticina 1-1 BBBD Race 1]|uniref:Uncharacterized protein n=1 Tax=Puccinia triticina (isolate 1-1 / race 1 (BBBD)) TaxID=630390 RepID=A0A0C4FAJ4_PUCT1|nr:hypothetical protein PTTG_10237 [Puccinia triticina 1-1 BBBD Race 1]